MRFYNRLLAVNLCRLALGGQTVKKNLRLLASKFELDQSQRKWVAKRNASPKLASTCESVWPGLKSELALEVEAVTCVRASLAVTIH